MLQIKRFVFNPIEENTYIIYDESKEAVIIDCGAFHPEEKRALQQFISDNALIPKHLLNTHLHLDHAFGNKFIYDTYHLSPEYHPFEERVPDMQQQANAFGMKVEVGNTGTPKHLNEGDKITFGNTTLDVLMVSGHSPAGLCFYSKTDHVVFTGDVLFKQSVGRSDLWGGSHQLLISGIKNKLMSLPENTVVYPGHGPTTTIGNEKIYNPFLS